MVVGVVGKDYKKSDWKSERIVMLKGLSIGELNKVSGRRKKVIRRMGREKKASLVD
jgi:hypothetical protein